jgi:hypothetical protein
MNLSDNFYLVDTLERWYSLAFSFVQGGTNHAPVFDLHIRFSNIVLEGQGVLHPIFIVALVAKSSFLE